MGILTKIFGTRNDKIIRGIRPIVDKINQLEATFKGFSDEQIKEKTAELRERLTKGESLDFVLPEAFANCREASSRALGQRHFDVQLMGGIVLSRGNIAEMKTGEGKTLTATLPAYLHALTGKGAHVVTVNDYLAKRDAEWMAKVYNALGMEVGNIVHGLSDSQRREAYACDITYGTNNEFGFDFLRDNMKTEVERLVQRGHNFAIVDEVDSILIDEARTPLIISGPADTNTALYEKVNAVLPGVQKDIDYTVDEKARTVSLTEDGISKMENRLRLKNLYDPENVEWLHHIQVALKAHILFKKDVDYVVRNGEIIIVDEFTGRLMPGRRYSDGLHGALEAKEHVQVQQESQTLATVTFQNYFRLYGTLSGMTGTADTEAVEFNKIYKLDVVVIPTNRTLVRKDEEDVIYRTMREKFSAIAEEIKEATEKGQPVLVGTVSVEKSELLSSLLTKMSIKHEVLNAKNHQKEASIIVSAGESGHVTIATNMAGRGTDIVLGEGVKDAGGLYVIGTERHESRRIDNQLRGRSGRQGDPGRSRFFLSLEDDLMRIFASDRLSSIMARLGMEEGEAIVSPMVTRAIEKAQRRVEEQNFSSRKNLLEYDDVMNQQRQVVYERRREALFGQCDLGFMQPTVEGLVDDILGRFSPQSLNQDSWAFDEAASALEKEMGVTVDVWQEPSLQELSQPDLAAKVASEIESQYKEKAEKIGDENMRKIESYLYLQIIDQSWKEHLLAMDALKDSVSLRGYGQRDPLQEYKKEAFQLFASMIGKIELELTTALLRLPPQEEWTQGIESHDGAELSEEDFAYHHHDGETAFAEGAQRELAPDSQSDDVFVRAPREHRDVEQQVQTYKREAPKVGRNDLCPCGSGKKFKKCHGLAGALHGG